MNKSRCTVVITPCSGFFFAYYRRSKFADLNAFNYSNSAGCSFIV